MEAITIGKLSNKTGIGIETIRFYERDGLLPSPQRNASGYRVYQAEDVQRLEFIQRSKSLGFSLSEIGKLLQLSTSSVAQADAKALVVEKQAIISEKIADLTRIHNALSSLSGECNGHGPADQCPILNALSGKK